MSDDATEQGPPLFVRLLMAGVSIVGTALLLYMVASEVLML